MPDFKLTTPVAFIVFNRPEVTRRVFAEIRRARPKQLLLIADGPRAGRVGEAELCAEVRKIVSAVDWDCEVLKNFSDVNLGCKKRVSSGIDWVFDRVEEAIILEDDCLPDPSFFRFCQELLEKYRGDSRVMSIGGSNYQATHDLSRRSYYFSRFNHVWGWASWRRAWSPHYDVTMKDWPEYERSGKLRKRFGSWLSYMRGRRPFQRTYLGLIDTWDYQWTFAVWKNNGVTIIPEVNLISNIGFGADATHTQVTQKWAELPTQAMTFPLKAPSSLDTSGTDSMADSYTQKNIFDGNILEKIWRKAQQMVSQTRHK